MSDPLRRVLYAPRTGQPEILEITGYSAKEGVYLVGARCLQPKELVALTEAQVARLGVLTGDARNQQLLRYTMGRRVSGIREAYDGPPATWDSVVATLPPRLFRDKWEWPRLNHCGRTRSC